MMTWTQKKIQHLNAGGRARVVYSMMTPALDTAVLCAHFAQPSTNFNLNYLNYGWKSIPLS